MKTCPKHNRWIELQSGAKRDCPECPKRSELRHVYGLLVDRVMVLTPEDARRYDGTHTIGGQVYDAAFGLYVDP